MVTAYQQQHGLTPGQRDQMIIDHLPQVRFIASRIHERLPSYVQLDDLVSAGVLGLIAAIDNFDYSRNVKIRTYAEHKIRGFILNSISKLQGTPRQRNTLRRDFEKAIAAAEQRIGSAAGAEEIAAELNMPLEDYHAALLEIQSVSLGRLETVDDDEEGGSVIKHFADPKGETPDRILERDQLKQLIVDALETLPEMERTVLNMYYQEGLNLREIASIMDLHMTRISQIKTQAVLRLRARFEKLWPGKVEL